MKRQIIFATLILTVAVFGAGCKNKSKLDAAKSSAGGGSGEYHLLVESGQPDPKCLGGSVARNVGDHDLASEVAWAAEDLEVPGVLISHTNEELVYGLQELFEADCALATKVEEGDIKWSLRVSQPGTSTDCMTGVLTRLVPGTDSSDWAHRVSSGQVIHESLDYRAISRMQHKLEGGCSCKLEKVYVVE